MPEWEKKGEKSRNLMKQIGFCNMKGLSAIGVWTRRGKLFTDAPFTLFAMEIRRTLAKSPAFLFFFILIAKIRNGESFGKLSPFLLSYIPLFVVVRV